MNKKTIVETKTSASTATKQRFFERREIISAQNHVLWRIERGTVRAVTWDENGTSMTLGYWGVGDIIGYPLSKVQPYHLECLTYVETVIVPFEVLTQNLDALLEHIQQLEQLMSIVNCKGVSQRIWQFLVWLSNKFGRELEQGKLIELVVTHQEIADVLNTTRVTVTRMLRLFQAEGKLQKHKRKLILMSDIEVQS
jgi:CRP-like cAMP-binding protein